MVLAMFKWLVLPLAATAAEDAHYVDNYFDCPLHGEYLTFRDQLIEVLRLRKLAENTHVDGAKESLLDAAAEIEGETIATAAGIFTMMSDADYPKLAHDYFRHLYNNSITSGPYERDSQHDFCIFGWVNAQFVMAKFQAEHEGNFPYADQLLRVAAQSLNYDRFDFVTSSKWPYSSWHVLRNLYREPNTRFILDEEPYLPPVESPFTSIPLNTGTSRGTAGDLQHVEAWLTDTHSSASTEIVDFWTRLLTDRFTFHIHRESLDPRCIARPAHFQMCSDTNSPLRELLGSLNQGKENELTEQHRFIEQYAEQFYTIFEQELANVDIFVCSMPAIWCRLFHKFTNGGPNHDAHVLAWIPQTIMLWLPDDMRVQWAHQFVDLALDPKHMIIVPTQFLSEQILWQVGIRVPVVRYFGLYMNATYVPVYSDTVLVTHRPSIEVDSVLKTFLKLPGAQYLSKKVEFVTGLRQRHQEERKAKGLSTDSLPPLSMFARYRCLVFWPYDVNTMMLHELYSSHTPMMMPRDYWRWASRFGELYTKHVLFEDPTESGNHTYAPIIADRQLMDPYPALYWSQYHEANRLPHVLKFDSISDLFHLIQTTELDQLAEISNQMRQWTDFELNKATRAWEAIVDGLMIGDTSSLKHGIVEDTKYVRDSSQAIFA